MSPLTAGRTASAAALLAVLALGAAGCTDDPSVPDIPDDFTRGGTSVVRLAYPEDWALRKNTGDADLTVTDKARPTAQLAVLENVTFAPIPEHALSVTQNGRQSEWRDYEQERSDITVPGTRAAYEVEYSYTAEDGDVVEGIDLVLVDEDRMAHQVTITWAPGALGPETVDAISQAVEVVDV